MRCSAAIHELRCLSSETASHLRNDPDLRRRLRVHHQKQSTLLQMKRHAYGGYTSPFGDPIQIPCMFNYECTATRGISLPSPPSSGVSTFSGSGQATGGTPSGP